MAGNFLNSAMGGADGLARMAGQQVGNVVEKTVKNAMGGKKKEEEKKGGGIGVGDVFGGKKDGKGGFGVGDALSLVTGKKEEKGGGGFGVGDALSLVTGKKEEKGGGGFGVGDALSLVTGKKEQKGGGGVSEHKPDDKDRLDAADALSFD